MKKMVLKNSIKLTNWQTIKMQSYIDWFFYKISVLQKFLANKFLFKPEIYKKNKNQVELTTCNKLADMQCYIACWIIMKYNQYLYVT